MFRWPMKEATWSGVSPDCEKLLFCHEMLYFLLLFRLLIQDELYLNEFKYSNYGRICYDLNYLII